ncbi:hypothetical protein SDC9_79526 [bioreactor metagenome]|uniref:Uncharacterized protein n=1 Tax=bioreactor metagenome TaxID=1076179 RepID=A0A644YXC5_9ZZZZ
MHQALRHEIKRGKAVADDGLELAVKPRLHHLRKRVAIDFVRFANRHIAQNIVCVFNGRRMRSIRKRLEQFATICDAVRFVNHHAASGLLAQIRELFQHLCCGFIIERRLKRSVVKSVFGQDHLAVDRILRVEKMDVPRRNNGDSEPIAKRHNLAVDLKNTLLRRLALPNQKRVVSARLNLQKIIGSGEIFDALLPGAIQNRLIQLSCLTGRAKDQPFAIEGKQTKRNDRIIVKMIQMRIADDAIEVLHAGLRLGQDYDVVCCRALLLPSLLFGLIRAYRQLMQPQRTKLIQQFEKDLPRRSRVVCRPVMFQQNNAERFADGVQLMIDQIMHQIAREHQCIGILIGKFEIESLAVMANKAHVKLCIVRNQAAPFAECVKAFEHLSCVRCAGEHFRCNSGELRNVGWDHYAIVDKCLKTVNDCAVLQLDRTDLDNFALLGL